MSMSRRFTRFLFSAFVLFAVTSCTTKKEIVYFQPPENLPGTSHQAINQKFTFTIQPGDILGVMVSSLSPEASAMFNPYVSTLQASNANQNISSTALAPPTGYLVDETGN